jgi:hypothetical protein
MTGSHYIGTVAMMLDRPLTTCQGPPCSEEPPLGLETSWVIMERLVDKLRAWFITKSPADSDMFVENVCFASSYAMMEQGTKVLLSPT